MLIIASTCRSFATHTLWHLISILFCLHEQLSFISKICKFKDPPVIWLFGQLCTQYRNTFMAPVEKCVSVLPYSTYMSQVPISHFLLKFLKRNARTHEISTSVYWNPPFQNPRSTTEWLNLQVCCAILTLMTVTKLLQPLL